MPIVYDLNKPLELSKLADKRIFADTNVIADMFYDRSSLVSNSRAAALAVYHRFITQMLDHEIPLHITAQVLMETQSVFMKYDRTIYNHSHPKGQRYDHPKDYRADPNEMQARKPRYRLMLDQITNMGLIRVDDSEVTMDSVRGYISTMDLQSLDSNDYVLLTQCDNDKYAIITDDKDFGTSIAKCDLITGSLSLIEIAKTCGYQEGN